MEKMYNVGKIVNTHGLIGEIRVIATTDFADERFQVGNAVYLFEKNSKKPEKLIIRSHRKHKNFDLLMFEGFTGIHQVERMKEGTLKISEKQLTDLAENEYYFHEIIGCSVVTTDGEELGEITEILTPGANDVWVVKGSDKKEKLIPYIADVVKEINISDKKITIEVMEGLLD
ncbi:ribosome maturation factor RimM [Listeria ivanovii]|uniref:Ribosome maturation factor RimM n=1 Tax=Listeria ivanovii (strain ATCC BAA-678 / PAM 55) TaxID=881621 RepID=G2ZBH1_LISIP|nr:ribosome maturation factor RimM [Listeria ivanovii]AHI56304.1 16S rRNA-processing protein RimM [Listeria ivanovii WSLC3009]AIS65731.1 16S rRNA processing protein RimM [Listeria ivanovii subsp. ivanovii]MBC1759238.1 ribosome maturation factor RimM [Listeria ivanovii]MBK3914259.1 ribosome maturation factor RimM [Listeria ivanovii subsp. ivanovii]MBK3920903.1 ribosome maturation factor RimM [Listeria ivanovii subsp. ivanovii]